MRNGILSIAFTLVTLLQVQAAGVDGTRQKQASTEPSPGKNNSIVARINGQPLEMKEFSRTMTRQYGRRAIDWFVERILIEQAASKHNVGASEEEIKKRKQLAVRLRMQEFFHRTRMTPSVFQKVSDKYGLTQQKLQREIARSIPLDRMRRQVLLEKLLKKKINFSRTELRQHYRWQYGERIAGAQIVVKSVKEARQIASTLGTRKISWDALVKSHSLDQRSAPYGGRFRPVPVTTELGQTLLKLGSNKVGLFRQKSRWHVIRPTDHIASADPSFEEMLPQLKRELFAIQAQDRADAYIAELRRQATVIPNVAPSASRREILGRDVVAYVNHEPISVMRFARAMIARFGNSIIEPIVQQQLVFQKAREEGVSVSAEQIEARIQQLAREIGEWQDVSQSPNGKFNGNWSASRQDTQNRKNSKSAKESISPQTVRALLLAEKMAVQRIYVNDQELREEYNARYGRHVELKVIVTNSASRAKALRQRALEGASFTLIAQAHSRAKDPFHPEGFRIRSTPGEAYYRHVKKLSSGDIAPILRLDDQYHLIKIIDRKQPQNPPPLKKVREKIERRVRRTKSRKRMRAWLKKVKAESRVKIMKHIKP